MGILCDFTISQKSLPFAESKNKISPPRAAPRRSRGPAPQFKQKEIPYKKNQNTDSPICRHHFLIRGAGGRLRRGARRGGNILTNPTQLYPATSGFQKPARDIHGAFPADVRPVHPLVFLTQRKADPAVEPVLGQCSRRAVFHALLTLAGQFIQTPLLYLRDIRRDRKIRNKRTEPAA